MNRPPFTFHRMDLPRKRVEKSGTGILAALAWLVLVASVSVIGYALWGAL